MQFPWYAEWLLISWTEVVRVSGNGADKRKLKGLKLQSCLECLVALDPCEGGDIPNNELYGSARKGYLFQAGGMLKCMNFSSRFNL